MFSLRTKIFEILRQQYVRPHSNFCSTLSPNTSLTSMLTQSESKRFLATGGVRKAKYFVKHDTKASQFYIDLNGNSSKAYLEYQKLGNVYDFVETYVPDNHRGKGLANILAVAAFDHVVSQKKKIRISCSYLQQFYSENYDKYKNYVLDADPDE